MDSPFTVVRGGQYKAPPLASSDFATYDRSRAKIDRIKAEIVAERDQYLTRKRLLAKTP